MVYLSVGLWSNTVLGHSVTVLGHSVTVLGHIIAVLGHGVSQCWTME